MTANDKRNLLVTKVLTREKKNKYSQDANKRTLIESGWGDCSGTVWYWYKKLFGINIGTNTEAQINSNIGKRVNMTISEGVPDESKMKKGDLLFFRGSDNSRTEGVGHVEMYIGNGKIFGHSSGIGGTVKDMKTYCRQRQNTSSTSKLRNKGLICVMRFIPDDELQELTEINDIIWELAHRKIITNSDLWLEKLEKDKDCYWLARKSLQYIRTHENNNKNKVSDLEKVWDIVWEYGHRNIITNNSLWQWKLTVDANSYWLARKMLLYIRTWE